MNEAYITQFINHGHVPDPTGNDRNEDGYLKCQKCPAVVASYEGGKLCPFAETIHISVHRREISTILDSFGGMKSGKKITKKVKQMYSRDIRRLTEQAVDERLQAFNDIVKPKPKWVPAIVWKWMRNAILKEEIKI